ncbi:MAG: hypothetical protein ACUVYA_12265 [Planctomycetota bacterium]
MTATAALALCLSAGLGAPPCGGRVEVARGPVALPIAGPEEIALDESDGSFWVSSATSHSVVHLDPGLRAAGGFEAPFPPAAWKAVTGIAYRPDRDTLLLAQPYLREIREVEKDGAPTGLAVSLAEIPQPVNPFAQPFVKGIAFDLRGDGGRGSIWLVESVMTAVYEVSLEGAVLRSFCHPDDRDGCPGFGTSAPSGGLAIYARGGVPLGLELLGGSSRRDQLVRVDFDGNPTGLRFPLEEIGGTPGGFVRLEGAGREGRDILLVTVESSAELYVLELSESSAIPLSDLACEASERAVRLNWTARPGYDAIEVLRNGERIAALPPSAASFEDSDPPEGRLRYEVAAAASDCESRLACAALVGPGRVLASAPIEARYPVDIAEDADGYLWIATLSDGIFIYDKDLASVAFLPSPLSREDDAMTGIAYNPVSDTFFVYNARTDEVLEIDVTGAWVREPFWSGIPYDPEFPPAVTAMLYDPAGAGGEGSFQYLDAARAAVEERTRSGELLGRCLHPDAVAEPFPYGSDLGPYTGGLTAVPGSAPPRLAVTGGRVREGRATRILAIDPASCAAVGSEIPLDDVARFRTPTFLGIHRTTHAGRAVVFCVLPGSPAGTVLEVDAEEPRVPRLADLSCTQRAEAPEVEIRFSNPGGLDAVEVLRDGELIAALEGSATSHLDAAPALGVRAYEVRGVRGGERGDGARCALRVGPGSVRAQVFSHPAAGIHQIAPDPARGEYIVASLYTSVSDQLYRFGLLFGFLGTIPSPFRSPEQVAALALRSRGAEAEIYCLGWNPGAAHETGGRFPLKVIDRSGAVLRSLVLYVPGPRREFVAFPSGMAWDSGTDTLWLLERNSRTVVNFDLDGAVLSAFPHPAPIHQDFVYDYGLAVDGARGTLYLASAGRYDREVTRVVELSRFGTLTGVEIPVGRPDHEAVRGFALSADGRAFAAAAVANGVTDLVLYRAFGPLRPVERLTCAREGSVVRLAWRAPEGFDSIAIDRDGQLAAVLPGDAVSWLDESPGLGPGIYRVAGRRGDVAGPSALCGPARARIFIRGDAEENGHLNISDAIAILAFLFLGGDELSCPKAADADDSGALDITDAIALLGYLFLSGTEPPRPFPHPGLDPTDDALACAP